MAVSLKATAKRKSQGFFIRNQTTCTFPLAVSVIQTGESILLFYFIFMYFFGSYILFYLSETNAEKRLHERLCTDNAMVWLVTPGGD